MPAKPTLSFAKQNTVVNFLPGPVTIPPDVHAAFCAPAISHRSDQFMSDMQETKRILCDLVGAQHVEILLGSGTLSNDIVAGQLSLLSSPGLVLSHGEFGTRLINHVQRWQLPATILRSEWGTTLDYKKIEQLLQQHPEMGWVWSVHCETSTGILNDIERLKSICKKYEVKLCLDCISSIGNTPVNLQDVYLATAVSGKALASYPGLAMVFYNHTVSPAPEALPRYLDLAYYAAKDGVPFTISTNLLYGLRAALQHIRPARFDRIEQTTKQVRDELRTRGFDILAPDQYASPAVITIVLPEPIDSVRVGDRLKEEGFLLSYKSYYLVQRNWIQVCVMTDCLLQAVPPLVETLDMVVNEL
ncbi:MAG: pyridoxal-phosphate-dependent aminotransferase family protein [Ardenticatenaceae bacterium]